MAKLPAHFSVQKAHQTQRCLSKQIIHEDRLPKPILTVGGVDVAYASEVGVGAAVVLNYDTLEVLESVVAVCPVKLPYVPTLLSFRELPPVLATIGRLEVLPDVLLVDAQGYAHPYRFGFASRLGLALGKPTIGVAKRRLIGEPTEQNGRTLLFDKGEVIGEVVISKEGCKPIFVSVGHMISLETAVQIVRHCSRGRIPEPTLQAHNLATKTKRNFLSYEPRHNIRP